MPSGGLTSPQGEGEPRDWVEIESSSIRSVAFDRPNTVLYVKFTSGDIWKYEGVTFDKYRSLLYAPSSGAFLRKQIIPHHAGTKITDSTDDE